MPQLMEKSYAVHKMNVSEHTVHHTLLHMGLGSQRLVGVPILTPLESTCNGHAIIGTGPWTNGRRSFVQ